MRTDQWTISTENWICEYPEEIRKIEISRIDRVDIIRTHKEGNLKSGPSFLCVRDQSYGVILIKEYSKRQISVKALFPKTCLIVMSGGYAKRLTLNGLNTQDAELIIEVDGNAYPVKGTFLPGRLQDSESVYSITENHSVVWIFPDVFVPFRHSRKEAVYHVTVIYEGKTCSPACFIHVFTNGVFHACQCAL